MVRPDALHDAKLLLRVEEVRGHGVVGEEEVEEDEVEEGEDRAGDEDPLPLVGLAVHVGVGGTEGEE